MNLASQSLSILLRARLRSACVALQNDDPFLDAVVITALPTVPFCCHADLITMNRDQLVEVANTLNKKLPLAMQIDTSILRTERYIRNSIELLVGIRTATAPPPTPTANRSLSLSVSQLEHNPEVSVSSTFTAMGWCWMWPAWVKGRSRYWST